jgi:hypothetical protein
VLMPRSGHLHARTHGQRCPGSPWLRIDSAQDARLVRRLIRSEILGQVWSNPAALGVLRNETAASWTPILATDLIQFGADFLVISGATR